VLRGRWQVGGLAAGGVVATHLLTFLVAAPDAHHRAELLARTGHFSLTLVSAVALGAIVTLAVRLLPMRRPALALMAVQSAGWLALESVERLSHHHADWELGLIALGVAVQAVLALVGALLLRAVRRVIAFITARRRPAPPTAAPARRLAYRPLNRPALLAGAAGVRGPPSGS